MLRNESDTYRMVYLVSYDYIEASVVCCINALRPPLVERASVVKVVMLSVGGRLVEEFRKLK